MKEKVISIIISLLLTTTILSSIGAALSIQKDKYDDNLDISSSYELMELSKKIYSDGIWVDEIEVYQNTIIRFNITLTYHDIDGPSSEGGIGFKIFDIVIKDIMPEGLEYLGNSTPPEPSIDDRTVIWDLGEEELEDNESYSIEFDVNVSGLGELKNVVTVNATERCYGKPRYTETNATIYSKEYINSVSKDVDEDGNQEVAIDENHDPTDGYEVFEDPDNSSDSILSEDGDGDEKIDHFIDTDSDKIPDVYWDPDDDVLTPILIEDIDYDETDEWVFDTDGDEEFDFYFDPDDDQIYPYVIFKLTINYEGKGLVQVEPDGKYFLDGFVVSLKALETVNGWSFTNWSGDITGENPNVSIIIDDNKEVTAHYNYSGQPPEPPEVCIKKPKENWLYIYNIPIRPRLKGTKIIGPITIRAQVKVNNSIKTDDGIEKVDFYIDGKYVGNDTQWPYTYYWKPESRIKNEQNHTIKVIAYDTYGNSNIDEITVIRDKWRPLKDTPILSALLGLLILNRLRGSDNESEGQEDKGDEIDTKEEKDNSPNAEARGPYSGIVGRIIIFDASDSYDPNNDTLSYRWDFGDGNTGNGKSVEHKYSEPGKYTLELTVTDETGLTDTYQTDVNVEEESEEDNEADLFLYIVTGLGIILLATISGIFAGRKLYV